MQKLLTCTEAPKQPWDLSALHKTDLHNRLARPLQKNTWFSASNEKLTGTTNEILEFLRYAFVLSKMVMMIYKQMISRRIRGETK